MGVLWMNLDGGHGSMEGSDVLRWILGQQRCLWRCFVGKLWRCGRKKAKGGQLQKVGMEDTEEGLKADWRRKGQI